jgi:mannosyltransferase OCH1-like enzyme
MYNQMKMREQKFMKHVGAAGLMNEQKIMKHVVTVGLMKQNNEVQNTVTDVILPDVSSGMIPRVIYQTWVTKDLPPGMTEAVRKIKDTNPDFRHELYDDADCRTFIEMNYPIEVLNAFDTLVPGAYKADLWRYCILYLYGGIYLDIKFEPVNGFRFDPTCNEEQFCYDHSYSQPPIGISVYNAFMITRPGNAVMKQCIIDICKNCTKKLYHMGALQPTGPWLLGKYVQKGACVYQNSWDSISLNSNVCFSSYPTYRSEQKNTYNGSTIDHYSVLWKKRMIYK